MSKLPSISGAEAIAAFERADFALARIKGSHHVLKKAGHAYVLTVPVHAGKKLGPGLLKALIKGAGLDVDEFVRLLHGETLEEIEAIKPPSTTSPEGEGSESESKCPHP